MTQDKGKTKQVKCLTQVLVIILWHPDNHFHLQANIKAPECEKHLKTTVNARLPRYMT